MITTGIDKRVQVQQIIDNQLPEFVLSESPKAADFLKQYYISQEYRGGPIDITDNLDQYLKLDNLTPEVITARTTLGVGITDGDDSITVDSTKGFPDQYGLLKIGDEVITYTGIAGSTFTGCERGFSGITSYHSSDNPSELVFSDTDKDSHTSGAVVQNLSALFLQEFYKKLKISLTPGLEGVDFVSNLDVNNFIKEARTFYEAKGTDESFRILFNVLYGVDPKVIDLENFLVKPSSAKYIRRERIVAELLSGNALKLEGQTITKSTDTASTASISEVEKLTGITGVSTAEYFNLDIFVGYDEQQYVTGTFDVPGKSRVIGNVSAGSSVITVDSTIGFSTSGTIISGINTNIVYTDKTINQFLGVTSITEDIISGQNLRSDEIIYGYEDGDINKKVELRITGVLSKFVPSDENRLSLEGETILIKGVGEPIENNATTRKEVLANSWQYNTSTILEIKDNQLSNPFELKTSIDKAYLKVGDTVEILERISNPLAIDQQKVFVTNKRVLEIIPAENKVRLEVIPAFDASKDYDLRKIISKSSSSGVPIHYGNNTISADIQNTYIESESSGNITSNAYGNNDNDSVESLYVATNSLPSYEITDEVFKSSISSAVANTTIQGYNTTTRKYSIISFSDAVPFVTGDSIQYTPGTTPLTGLREGVYYIKNVGTNQIKLYLSASFVETDGFEEFTIPTTTTSHTFTLLKHYNKTLQSQKILKKFPINPNLGSSKDVETVPGPVGMLINGIEIENSKSSDAIYYGELNDVSVISKGTNYDLVNLPKLDVATSVGVTALVQPVISGRLTEIQVDPQNFDIEDVLSIKLTGGNSGQTVLRPILKKRNRELEFDARIITQGGGVDTVSETITFTENHNLKNGQALIYNRNNYPALGIGTYQGSNNPFNPGNDELVPGATYYPQVLGISSVFLYRTEKDYNAGINTIGYTAVTGKNVGTHKFKVKYAKNTLNSVAIIQGGGAFENRSVFVKPEKISTIDSIINFKSHGFSEGDKVVYGGGSLVNIVGLSTTVQYKVIKQNDDSFRLADAGIAGTVTTDYIEKNYVKFTSSGTGFQEFKYPDIEISSQITYSVGTSDKVVLTPVIRGHLTDVLLYEEGTSYGSDTVVNYENNPEITIKNGIGRKDRDIHPALTPIIIGSKIEKVRIDDGGEEYYSTPELEVVGDGFSAKIRAVIDRDSTSTNYLRIVDTVILNGGTGFTTSNTRIRVIPSGKDAVIKSNIRRLSLNNIQTQSPYNKKYTNTLLQESEYGLRYSVVGYSTDIGKSYFENITTVPPITNFFRDFEGGHSKIIGWAYDGNPIYGPRGYSNPFDAVEVKILSPSYTLDASKVSNRPGITTYPAGFFADDYSYDGSGDLDEHNGRYCVTPEFPNGVYAYFAGISSTGNMEPKFPYFIGNSYRSTPEALDRETSINQKIDFNNSDLVRNTFPYKSADKFTKTFFVESDDIVSQSAVVEAVTQGDVESIEIIKSGDNYKVGDSLIFDDTGTNGNGLSAIIETVEGPSLSTIETTYTEYSGIKFTWQDSKKVLAHFDTPHLFEVGDNIEVSGLTTDIQSLQGTHSVGITTESTILYKEVAANGTAGIITDIFVGRTSLISVGSSIGIGTESLAVINKFDDRNILRVRRGVVGTAHTLSTEVKLNPTILTLPVETDNFDSQIDEIVYFNPRQALGIGSDGNTGIAHTTWVSVGETASNVSVPAQSIYLPNHPFKTGQKVTFSKPAGKSNIGVSDDGTIPLGFSIPLSGTSQDVYVINKSDDFIGIVTDIDNIGVNTESSNASPGGLYFLSNGDYDFEYTFQSNFEQVTGTIETISALVSVSTNHNLISNDVINLSINANESVGVGTSESVIVKHNSSINKLLINPKTFGSAGVNTSTNTITLNGHDTKTGDKVYYSATDGVISGLTTGGYFVYRVDDNNIRLANTYHNVVNYPPKVINLVSIGGTSQEISLINPNIPVIRNNDLVFDVSDSSLEGYDFNLYYDSKFQNRFVSTGSTDFINVTGVGTVGVTTTATVTLKYYVDNPNSLFYNIEKSGFISTSDVSVKNGSKITYESSKYNGEYSITGVGDTTFSILLDKKPESLIYDNGDTDVLRYTTNSKSTTGPIASVKVNFGGVGYKQMPKFVSVASTVGENAVILPRSNSANKIEDVNITNIGFEYASDKTLAATAKISSVIALSDYGAIEVTPPIEIVDGGRGYQSAPNLVVVDKITREVAETGHLTAGVSQSTQAIDSVNVVSSPKGLNVPQIFAVDNTNGVSITRVTVGHSTVVTDNATGIVTFTLETPVLGFSTDPFIPDDKAWVEQVENEYGNTFNSPSNGYNFFPVLNTWVTKVGLTRNPFQMEISILDIANNPGLAKTVQNFGQVVNKNRYPTFNTTQTTSVFSEGETILVKVDGEFIDVGIKLDRIANDYVKLSGKYPLKKGDRIKGVFSGSIATLNVLYDNTGKFKVDYSSEKNKGWYTNTGKLNEDYQVLPDNDYYQSLSYTIQSPIEYQKLVSPVNNLLHTSGLKNFADTGISSSTSSGLSTAVDGTTITRDIFSENRVDIIKGFDLVTDSAPLTNPLRSKYIRFETKELVNYFKCSTNRVLTVDDIVSLFRNATNNVKKDGTLQLTESFGRFLIQSRNPTTKKIQLTELLTTIDFTNEDVYTIQKGNIFETTPLLDIIGDKEETTPYQLLLTPSDIFNDDIDIKIFQTELGAATGVGTTSFGFVNLTSINQNVSAATTVGPSTSTIISSGIGTIDSFFTTVELNDTFSNENKIVELYVTHDGTNSYISSYDFDTNTTNAIGSITSKIESGVLSVNYENDRSNEVSVKSHVVGFGTTAAGIGTYRFKTSAQNDGQENTLRLQSSYNRVSAASTILEFSKTDITSSKSIIRVSVGNTSAIHQVLMAHDESNVYYQQYPFVSIGTTTGIGTFSSQFNGSDFELVFHPDSVFTGGDDIQVQTYSEVINSKLDLINLAPDLQYGSGLEINSLSLLQYDSINGTRQNRNEFKLTHNESPIFGNYFNPSDVVDLAGGTFNIPDNFFYNDEKLLYTPASSIDGIGTGRLLMSDGNPLPEEVYVKASGTNSDTFQLSTTKAGAAVTFIGFGTGNYHLLEMSKKNEKGLFTLNGMVQSPLAFTPITETITNNMAGQVGLTTTLISVSGISSIILNDVLKINDEYLKVTNVGVGTTSVGPITENGTLSILEVERGFVGTSASTHADNSTLRLYRGGYNIVGDSIFFTEPPSGIDEGLKAASNRDSGRATFSGRVYLRQNYSTNAVFDDISGEFTGIGQTFTVKVGGANTTGIVTGSTFVALNGLFQSPTTENNQLNNYDFTKEVSGITSFVFSGITSTNGNLIVVDNDPNQNQLPRGGQIISIGSSGGLGIAPLVGASVTAVTNSVGNITSVGIGSTDYHGSGYTLNGNISIGITDVAYTHRFVSAGVNSVTVNPNGIGAISAFTPTDATFKSDSGELTLIKSSHGLITADTYTATTGTQYNGTVGILTVKLSATPSPALANGQIVRISNESLTFTCKKDSDATEHLYPRVSDPISGRYVPISNVTGGDTFEINVLKIAGAPSSNVSTHTFVSGISNGISRSANTVGIATGSIAFRCSSDYYKSIQYYPRTTDEAHNATLSIKSATDNSITVGVGSAGGGGTGAVITATVVQGNIHTYVSGLPNSLLKDNATYLSPYSTGGLGNAYDPVSGILTVTTTSAHGFSAAGLQTATAAVYNPHVGIMTITTNGSHGYNTGDYVKIAENSLTFTCAKDNNDSNHTYPRATDPIFNKWIQITKKTATQFSIQVLDSVPSTNTSDHTFVSGTVGGILKANNTVGIGTSAFTFTCTQDSNVSLHSYPRKDKENPGSDPAHNSTLGVESVGTTTSFTLNVGKSPAGSGGALNFSISSAGKGYVNPRILPPAPVYENLDVIGISRLGIGLTTDTGTSLQMDINPSPSSTSGIGSISNEVNSFDIKREGFGFKRGDVFTPIGIVTDRYFSSLLTPLEFTVNRVFTDAFASWNVGEFDYIDSIKNLQDGFKTRFPLNYNGELVSFQKDDAVEMDIQALLLIFVNGVLQVPGDSYTFGGGTTFAFSEPPDADDTVVVFFYKGTNNVDVTYVDVVETLKTGDQVQIFGDGEKTNQEKRTISGITTSDTIETNLYYGKGINETTPKPLTWIKQKIDKTVNGEIISKARPSLEPLVFPTARVIADFSTTDAEMFVDTMELFDYEEEGNMDIIIVDESQTLAGAAFTATISGGSVNAISIASSGSGFSTTTVPLTISPPRTKIQVGVATTATATATISGGNITSITITNPGLGYTVAPYVIAPAPVIPSETVGGVTQANVDGFSGIVTGITTAFGSGGTGTLALKFFLNKSSGDFTELVNGYPVYIYDTNIGTGVTSIYATGNDSVVGIGTTFIDNIYYVSSINRTGLNADFIANVDSNSSIIGIGTTGEGSGRFSWGRLSGFSRSSTPISIGVTSKTINAGLSTFPRIQRRNIGIRNSGGINKPT